MKSPMADLTAPARLALACAFAVSVVLRNTPSRLVLGTAHRPLLIKNTRLRGTRHFHADSLDLLRARFALLATAT